MDVRVGLWETWAPKSWCFWTVVLEKTPENPLDCKEIKSVNPKGGQPWIFIRRTDAGAEAPTLWPPDVKSWLNRKDPDAGKDWKQEEKQMTENEMVGWHHWFNGHEFEQSLGDGEGQGSLAFCIQSLPSSGSFLMSQLFTSGSKVLELQLQQQSFQWIFRVDFL